jgi:putative Mg2+ transporter-C (MgtC) family protein
LPGRSTLEVSLSFCPPGPPTFDDLAEVAEARGYRVLHDSVRITFADSQPLWRFCVVALDRSRARSPALLAQELAASDGVASFSIAPVRN